ncbi:MAG: hypothetical protein WBB67_08520 [bacterium]
MHWIKIVLADKQRVFYINIASIEKTYVDIENKEIQINFLGKNEPLNLRVDKMAGTERVSEDMFSHIHTIFKDMSAERPPVL